MNDTGGAACVKPLGSPVASLLSIKTCFCVSTMKERMKVGGRGWGREKENENRGGGIISVRKDSRPCLGLLVKVRTKKNKTRQ